MRAGWRAWVRGVSDALSSLGWGSIGQRLRSCGATSEVYTCSTCGDPTAAVVVRRLPCSVRGCVVCGRHRADADARRYAAAAERVPGYVAARLTTAELVCARVGAEALAQKRQTRAAMLRAARARRDGHDLRAARRGGWRWRLVTISPQWDVSDAWSYSVEGLRARAADAWERWERVYEVMRCPLSGAMARMEVSIGGHVHVHALVYGAWRSREALVSAAGCMVDVRAVERAPVEERDARTGRRTVRWTDDIRGAVRETVKYALKAPSPLRGAWMQGGAFRVAHPMLAARWIVAMRSRHLVRDYGVFRDALAAVDACEPEGEALRDLSHVPRACASCGCDCEPTPRVMATAMVARALGDRWRWRGRQGGPVPLPARVTIETFSRKTQ